MGLYDFDPIHYNTYPKKEDEEKTQRIERQTKWLNEPSRMRSQECVVLTSPNTE